MMHDWIVDATALIRQQQQHRKKHTHTLACNEAKQSLEELRSASLNMQLNIKYFPCLFQSKLATF